MTDIKIVAHNKNSKIYKLFNCYNIRMFPSDPTGSLDDFYFYNLGGLEDGKK